MKGLRIEYLVDRPHLVRTIAEWHWRDDGERTPLAFWIDAHSREAVRRDVPTAWVALRADRPVGCVSLIEANMDTHPELSPWLAALYVVEMERGRGIGTALALVCEDRAKSLGYDTLYCYTETARGFYTRLGWRIRSVEEYEAETVSILQKSLADSIN
jgi:GNAT superfamily N-acetyltransferase